MDTSHWPQGIGSVESTRSTIENENNKEATTLKPNKAQQQQALNCPRCNSNNTKFCYYNNYSLSQPRYLCKACKRYWTVGGNLRSVPVGGASRKNKSRPSLSSKKVIISSPPPKLLLPQNPRTHIDGQTLNLDFCPSNGVSQFGAFPFGINSKNLDYRNPSFCSSGFSNYGLHLSSLVSMPVLDLGFNDHSNNMHDCVFINGYVNNNNNNNLQGVDQENNAAASSSRISFPFEELRQFDEDDDEQGKKRQQGDWNGSW